LVGNEKHIHPIKQGHHSPEKPGKVGEFQGGQGKIRENEISFVIQVNYQ